MDDRVMPGLESELRAPLHDARSESRSTPVVVIGASAGGLEPLEVFFSSMPPDSGIAFIVMQHLSPDFRSMMAEILARHTVMETIQARDGIEIRPNVIYLNPPRSNLSVEGNFIRVSEVGDPLGNVSTIDLLFNSLAEDRGPDAIGIILSGSGSDGSRGATSIIQSGGVVIVQNPETAKFDGMPCAAIARGAATFITTPERMRTILSRLTQGEPREAINGDRQIETDPKMVILALLRDRFGSDFGLYKNATIGRRIDRRITMKGFADIDAYAEALKQDADELDALYHDILIGVTSFFRDREAFEFLRENVIPHIVDNQRQGEFIRVWVAGCATGEEAYSLAMAFDDYAERSGQRLNLKILATDVHKRSLEIATRGAFSRQQMKNVDKDILTKYFDVSGENYVALPRIRKYIVFSVHDLTSNPPFTRIDLVSCRNLLIYLNQPTQQKVLAYIHFALRKDGYLLLGPSETIGRLTDEFLTLSEPWRVYQKLRDVRLIDHSMPTIFGRGTETPASAQAAIVGVDPSANRVIRQRDLTDAYDALLKRFAPAGSLITGNGQLIRVFGDATRFIDITQGTFSTNLTDMLVSELRMTVTSGLEHLKRTPSQPFVRLVNLRSPDVGVITIEVRIEPLPVAEGGPAFHAVTLRQVATASADAPVASPLIGEFETGDILTTRVKELERDLAAREAGLQSLVEEFETSNEELQATNEELMASNEELQSTNEELHSVNEELYTVSAEHQRKIEQLIQLTNDMEHLLRATNIGTMFVDRSSCIRSFTPMAARAFNIMDQDIGRPISHITTRFALPEWTSVVQAVIEKAETFEREVDCDGRFFLLRILPYRARQSVTEGAVITLVDIDDLHNANRRLEVNEARFRALYKRTPAKLNSFDRKGRITEISDYWLERLQLSREAVVGNDMVSLMSPESRQTFVEEVLPRFWRTGVVRHESCQFVSGTGEILEGELSAIRDDADGRESGICFVIDVTERNAARRQLELRNRELERSNEALSQYANMASHDLQEPLRKIKSYCSILAHEIGKDVTEDARYAMNVLAEASDRLSLLVTSLLQFSRVSSNPLKIASVPLSEIVASAMSDLEVEIKNSGAVIEIGSLPIVLADRVLMQGVFQNLIGNALKYRKKDKTPHVSINAQVDGSQLKVTFTDEGIGFDPKFSSVIFEPLKRLHGVSEYAGAGIGLAVTKAIVDRHGWRIQADSSPQKGATFTILIPLDAAAGLRS